MVKLNHPLSFKRFVLGIALIVSLSVIGEHGLAPARATAPEVQQQLLELHQQGRLTLRAVRAWGQLPSEADRLALALREAGFNLLDADLDQLTLWVEAARRGTEPQLQPWQSELAELSAHLQQLLGITQAPDSPVQHRSVVDSDSRGLQRQPPVMASEGGQHALVIGNSRYQHAPLRNPSNDAEDMAQVLRERGFQVNKFIDLNSSQLQNVVRDFGHRLRDQRGVGLVYFAGHGVEVDGENFLIPVDNDRIQDDIDVRQYALSVQYLLERLQAAGNPLNVVILDACRNNPYQGSTRSLSRGLRGGSAPTGTLIAYAAAPGRLADDNPQGRNGLYTAHLIEAIQTGQRVEDVFQQTRRAVYTASNGRQEPWYNASLDGIYCIGGCTTPAAPLLSGAPGLGADAAEIAFWQSIQHSSDEADFKAYLTRFPDGLFIDLAQNRLAALVLPDSDTAVIAVPSVPIASDPEEPSDASAASPSESWELAVETSFWELVAHSTDPLDLQAYLHRYPQGQFSHQAQERLTLLQTPPVPEPSKSPVIDEPKPPEPEPGPYVRLTVHTTPAEARVRLMNIIPVYRQGMRLNVGDYDVEISAPGYQTYRRWHHLDSGAQAITVELTPEAPTASVAPARPQTPTMIAGRYRVRGDQGAIIEDTSTGLQWMRCSLGQTWTGQTCSGTAQQYRWDQAHAAVPSGWRLPTQYELRTLVYCSDGHPQWLSHLGAHCSGQYQRPTIVSAAFPNTPLVTFWSASTDAANSNLAWRASFGLGRVNRISKTSTGAVRVVRRP